MGSKKTVETKTSGTQTVAPPSWTMPGISAVSDKVVQAVNGLPGQQYTGDFVAQPNMGLVDKASQAYQAAAGQAPEFAQNVAQAAGRLQQLPQVNANNYTQSSAYDLNPVIQAATAPLFDQLTKQTLPGLRSSAIESGAYTGDRAMSVVPGQVIADTAQKAQQLAAQVGYQDFSDREARRLSAYQSDAANDLQAQEFNNTFGLQTAQALPDLYNAALGMQSASGDLYAGANQTETQAQQAQIDNALRKNEYSWKYPFQGLDIASSLLAQLSGGYGTMTSAGTNTQTTSSSGLGNVLQGVLGAASLVGSIPTGGGATLAGRLMSNLFKKQAA